VLLSDGGEVHVVDLAAAVAGGPFFARAAAQDRLAAARMRARFTGRSEEEALAAGKVFLEAQPSFRVSSFAAWYPLQRKPDLSRRTGSRAFGAGRS